MTRILASALVLVAAASAWAAGSRIETLTAGREAGEELLYLPNGKLLQIASLGQAPLLADLVYIWSIQFYSDYARTDRFRYVEHVFGDVISELDPHYIDAYWLGALIMTTEAKDLEAGLRLLEKGFSRNPDEWILPYLAGWECYYEGQLQRAAGYFDQAAAVPDAPAMVIRIRAGMTRRAGNLVTAVQLWKDVLSDPRSDELSRAIAERQIRDLVVRIDLERLGNAVEAFQTENARRPRSLVELVTSGYIDDLPLDPDGLEYVYDAKTGKVSSPADRLLGHRG